jgi:hypothetical protein
MGRLLSWWPAWATGLRLWTAQWRCWCAVSEQAPTVPAVPLRQPVRVGAAVPADPRAVRVRRPTVGAEAASGASARWGTSVASPRASRRARVRPAASSLLPTRKLDRSRSASNETVDTRNPLTARTLCASVSWLSRNKTS